MLLAGAAWPQACPCALLPRVWSIRSLDSKLGILGLGLGLDLDSKLGLGLDSNSRRDLDLDSVCLNTPRSSCAAALLPYSLPSAIVPLSCSCCGVEALVVPLSCLFPLPLFPSHPLVLSPSIPSHSSFQFFVSSHFCQSLLFVFPSALILSYLVSAEDRHSNAHRSAIQGCP